MPSRVLARRPDCRICAAHTSSGTLAPMNSSAKCGMPFKIPRAQTPQQSSLERMPRRTSRLTSPYLDETLNVLVEGKEKDRTSFWIHGKLHPARCSRVAVTWLERLHCGLERYAGRCAGDVLSSFQPERLHSLTLVSGGLHRLKSHAPVIVTLLGSVLHVGVDSNNPSSEPQVPTPSPVRVCFEFTVGIAI